MASTVFGRTPPPLIPIRGRRHRLRIPVCGACIIPLGQQQRMETDASFRALAPARLPEEKIATPMRITLADHGST